MNQLDPSPSEQPNRPSTAPAGQPSTTNRALSIPIKRSETRNGAPLGPAGSSPGPIDDPWRPIILSLGKDGGGIRGLSSLYLIREIMKEIQRLEDQLSPATSSTPPQAGQPSMVQSSSTVDQNQWQSGVDQDSDRTHDGHVQRLPLPCDYFDFMVGTSTGGLIAIMLGRLRMDIDECIREYHVLGNKIFRPHKWRLLRYTSLDMFQYSSEKFRDAVDTVVSKQCGCYGRRERCQEPDNHLLRQHDFKEYGDAGDTQVNSTCRSAVVTCREGGGPSAEVTVLFRTYDHEVRGGGFELELNPKRLHNSVLKIVAACRATAAAPTWFPYEEIRARKFIDGGVTDHNNPASLAWNEANEMAHRPGEEPEPTTKGPCVLLSIGTGKSQPPRKFGLYKLLHAARHRLTDTEQTHIAIVRLMPNVNCRYWRFNVPESNLIDRLEGLDTVKLDACKKKRKGTFWRRTRSNGPDNDTGSFVDAEPERGKGGYKPQKYQYKTYEFIREQTLLYRGTTNVSADITECARRLLTLKQRRAREPRSTQDSRWNLSRRMNSGFSAPPSD